MFMALYVTCAYGSLWNTEGAFQTFLCHLFCFVNFFSQPQPNRDKNKPQTVCLFPPLLMQKT